MNEVKRILNFWKEVNLLTPVAVKSIAFKNQESLNMKDVLKVPYNRIDDSLFLNNDEKYEIEIGFGDIKNTYLYEKGNIKKEDFVDGDGGESFIFTFKIGGDKKYKEKSFTISKFAFILLNNIISKNYDDIEYEIKKFNENIEIDLKSYENYNVENVKKITSLILKELNIDNLDEKILKKSFYLKLFSSREEEDSNESSFAQMDFYTRDLETIAKADLKDDSLLSNIIYSKENKNRQKIDDNKEFLEEITLPKNMPLGRWPSKYNPSLMQAVAINICTSKEYSPNIFSVNGPPGTGKTTLLKEIIADTIVEKASVISKLDLKDIKKVEIKGVKIYDQYSKIPDKLKKLGIIVASNNNSAVENISKDLPIAEDVFADETLSGLFDINNREDVYFTLASDEIFKNKEKNKNNEVEKTEIDKKWGLISAPYGKGNNIKKILEILPNIPESGKSINDFKFKLENLPNLEEAKEKFKSKYEEVVEYRNELNKFANKFLENKEKIANLSTLESNIDNLMVDIERYEKDKVSKNTILQLEREKKSNLKSSYSLLKKILNIFMGDKNPKILEINKKIKEISEEIVKIENESREKNNYKISLERELNKLNDLKKIIEKYLYKNESKVNASEEIEKKKEKEEQKNQWTKCMEESFYNNIAHNEESQGICPWGIEEFNKLREELFASSLQLIKAFIANSGEIKQNLKIFKLLQDRKSGQKLGYSDKERKEAFKECFHTLNLLIPVLSTTFASVSRAFKDFGENELGIVIIDEAGQATPFSAMGLLYRANRCIIVGDPLQVEPVMTVTSTLIRAIANKYELNKLEKEFNIAGKIFNYTSPSLSIQTLADYANLYYGKIGETEVGCPLVVHRRCLSPMFDISNRISYDDRMINKCMPDKKPIDYVLEKNEFIDVKGQEAGNGNHYVKEQGDKIIEIIKDCIENREINIFDNFKNLYVISPFTTVINGLKNDIKKAFKDQDEKKIKAWCDNCLGTVHKFQGKEANSVILLLGCDNNSKSSARWAAQAANILNVAATRAKKRFAIIGDLELWGKLNFFKEAKEILNKE